MAVQVQIVKDVRGEEMNCARLKFLGVAAWLLVLGCHGRSDPTANLPTYSLNVASRATGEPVMGARIMPFCGIPGDTNVWITDSNGLAKFRSWFAKGVAEAGGTYVTVNARGYVFTNFPVPLTNRVTTVLLDKAPRTGN